MDEILWNSVELRGMSTRLKNGEIEVSGEALVCVLYSGVDEERLQWFETTVPIQGNVECNVCEESLIHQIKTELAQADLEIELDGDGEERNLLFFFLPDMQFSLTLLSGKLPANRINFYYTFFRPGLQVLCGNVMEKEAGQVFSLSRLFLCIMCPILLYLTLRP